MLVELELTASPSFRTGLVTNPTVLEPTAPTLPTATSRGKGRLPALVTSQAQPQFPLQIQVPVPACFLHQPALWGLLEPYRTRPPLHQPPVPSARQMDSLEED